MRLGGRWHVLAERALLDAEGDDGVIKFCGGEHLRISSEEE